MSSVLNGMVHAVMYLIFLIGWIGFFFGSTMLFYDLGGSVASLLGIVLFLVVFFLAIKKGVRITLNP